MGSLEHKLPPPIVCLIIAAGMWLAARTVPAVRIDDGPRLAVAAACALLGLLSATLGFRAFSRVGTTTNPMNVEAASALVTGGVYRWTRNPMYLGLAALLVGWAVYLTVPWTLLGPVAFALFITRFQIIPEERALHANFGAEYVDYRRRVRRWL